MRLNDQFSSPNILGTTLAAKTYMGWTQLQRFYILSAGFSAARMGIGATSVLYMLSFGLNLGDIAVIKIVQALVIIFAEVPTGLIADTFGRRASVLAACIASILSFVFFICCESVIGFSVAEIFNGLCIALWSGAYEALVIDQTDATAKKGNFIESLFARISSYNAFATMAGGLVGGMLGKYSLVYPFYISAALMAVVIVFTLYYIKRDRVEKTCAADAANFKSRVFRTLGKMNEHHKNAWRFSLSTPAIRDFFIIQIIIQFSIQPLLHYWQPYFKSISLGMTTQFLGWIFFAYVGGQFVVSGIVSRLLKENSISPYTVNNLSALVSLIGFAILLISHDLYTTIAVFVLLQASLNVLRNNLGASFNRLVDSHDRATVLSSVSFISRIGMLINLGLLKLAFESYPVSWVFVTSVAAMGALVPLVLVWNRYFTRAAKGLA